MCKARKRRQKRIVNKFVRKPLPRRFARIKGLLKSLTTALSNFHIHKIKFNPKIGLYMTSTASNRRQKIRAKKDNT